MTISKIRKLAASMAILALGGALAAACSGGSADKPNGGTLNPPPVNDGTGKPSNATSYTCQEASDCGNWFCDCTDGFVVNSAFCKNGYCLDAAGACSNACKTNLWDHGSWSGTAGGGPGKTSVATTGGVTSGGDVTSGGFGGGGFGGSDGSGGFGGSGPDPVCFESGEACSDSLECCSFDCYFGTCS